MSTLAGLLALLLHMALMLATAPLLIGLARKAKARMVGREGPPIVQPWRDIARLLRKQPVVADSTSWLFRAAPTVSLAATLAAAALVPSFALGMLSGDASDLLVLAGLLALGRAALALAGMDTGTSFGGIGASREMTFAVVAEPALLLVIYTLALLAGTTNLDSIVNLIASGVLGLRISMAMALVAACLVAIAECGRVPVDNPATHLELTMVHEAMVLEYSGRHLALIELTAALRLLVWTSLILVIFAPFGIAPRPAEGGAWIALLWVRGLLAWGAKVTVLGLILAAFETTRAKLRVFRVPELLGAALLLGFLAAILLFVSQGFAAELPISGGLG
ncbi:MAG: NADH-quinone oxidoreductase subunit H [Acetobacteraceae bacterium]|nr:NADH-quinone oxidoreductase subunit H [Acetobacteraceae bacterium]